MYQNRIDLFKQLEAEYDGTIISYITGDRRGFETQIASDVIDIFISHLDKIGPVKKLILYLYTRGGDTSTAWNIVNLLRMYCDELLVLVPHKAHSSGTIICLGADRIIMTKQATLSPIDPSVNNPLNPKIPGTPEGLSGFPVSVEAVKGFIDLAKKEIGMKSDSDLSAILNNLADKVHPLVLGQSYRSRAQIKMLATRLLERQLKEDSDGIKKVADFLCSDSGSHDYTINRREAKDYLGLCVDKPSQTQYSIIKNIYDNYSEELGFGVAFNPAIINGAFSVRRGFIESCKGGSDFFITEGRCGIVQANGQVITKMDKSYEGWRHQDNKTDVIISDGQVNNSKGVVYEKSDDFSI